MNPVASCATVDRRTDARNLALIGLTAAVLAAQYFLAIDLQDVGYSIELHDRIISGEAASPYRYRVLVPFLVEGLAVAFSVVRDREAAFLAALAVYDVAGLLLLLASLYALLRQWFSAAHSFAAVLFIATVMPITFSYFRYHPWWILEVSFLSLGLICAYQRRFLLLGLVVIAAALNRETGIFLPVAVLLGWIGPLTVGVISKSLRRKGTWLAFCYVGLSAAIFLALRVMRGGAGPADQLSDVLARNLEPIHLTQGAYAVVLFLGAGWAFAALGYQGAPGFLRRVARTVPLYLAVFVVWGWWREVRILTTLYPLLITLIAWYVRPSNDEVSRKLDPG